MKKLHKGLLIGGVTLAVLVPASLVAADQLDMGHGQGRGNGDMTHDCMRTGNDAGSQMRLRDGTGPNHAANSATGGTGGQMRRGG